VPSKVLSVASDATLNASKRQAPSCVRRMRLQEGKMAIHTEWAAGWGTLALVNAGLAQGKHRSGLAWFVISLFLGPLATLILVLLDDPRERG